MGREWFIDSELSMCVCSFYHIVTKSVLNGTAFHFITKIIKKFNKSRDLFCQIICQLNFVVNHSGQIHIRHNNTVRKTF